MSHILLEGLSPGYLIPLSYKQLEARIQRSLYLAKVHVLIVGFNLPATFLCHNLWPLV